MQVKKILALGAGPKGIALAAKAQALRAITSEPTHPKFLVPDVLLVDNQEVAANWGGKFGYTDGNQDLATPPLKDVGFPYFSRLWGNLNSAVDQVMLKFGWPAFLIAHEEGSKTHPYSDWIDRGCPPPKLREWAAYLQWVERQSYPDQQNDARAEIDDRTIGLIDIQADKWVLDSDPAEDARAAIEADVLVVTGAGPPADAVQIDGDPYRRITDAREFWRKNNKIRKRIKKCKKGDTIGVIGSGAAAASVISELCKDRDLLIKVFSPSGVIYSRGESYDELRHYSNPDEWGSISEAQRKKFFEHTSNGVFPLATKREIDLAANLKTISGSVWKVEGRPTSVRVYLKPQGWSEIDDRILRREGEGPLRKPPTPMQCKFVIIATGFDEMWWTRILSATAREAIEQCIGGSVNNVVALKAKIGPALELMDMKPPLHLPMLATEQGPGFRSLHCLGLLSDRILSSYCNRPRDCQPHEEYS